MSLLQRILGVALGALLVGAVLVWWRTAPQRALAATTAAATVVSGGESTTANLVDQGAYDTALRLLGETSNTQDFAFSQTALRLADHDLDLAFTTALRELDANPPELSARASRLAARLDESQRLYASDQRRVAEMKAALARASGAQRELLQDELDLSSSQLELDQYEIEEANQDLEDAGGNLRRRVVAQMQERENREKSNPAPVRPLVASVPDHGGLVASYRVWQAQRRMQSLVDDAQRHAAELTANLRRDRAALAARLEANKSGISGLAQHSKQARDSAVTAAVASAAPDPQRDVVDTLILYAQTKQAAAAQQVLTLLDQRSRTHQSLSQSYQQWSASVASRGRAALHGLFAGTIVVAAVLLALLLLDRWSQQLFSHSKGDRRRVASLHHVTRVALQILAVLIALFMLIGVPSQFGTVLGIIGAGLTVALKDFIVAFIGWMILMGRNGMRLGDWVEINGVSGEVCELGMFHTVLLETGNWGEAGHPTGRRVTFTNSFAISGHYFNFSTSGQWLWDELRLIVPTGRDPHPIIDAIRKRVLDATAESARHAEQEWQRAVPRQSGRLFSGAPGIDVKPVVGGVELSVRYVTRAHERFALRTTLYQAAVDLLGEPAPLGR